jgi:N-acetylneuraminate synthase
MIRETSERAYIVAEIGINHNGDINIAKQLIAHASKAGVDAVKIQVRTPEVCVPREQWLVERDTPWGRLTYIDYRMKMEFNNLEILELMSHAKAMNVDIFPSVWDRDALERMRVMRVLDFPAIKIPSAMATNHELIGEASWLCDKDNQTLVISTGMCDKETIIKAMVNVPWNTDLVVMHCTSTYPCPPEDLNLKGIVTLRKLLGTRIGYSNHSTGIMPCVIARALGAEVIEAHITLDRSMWGTDQSASIEPHGFAKMVKYIRDYEVMRGTGKLEIMDSELPALRKLRGE